MDNQEGKTKDAFGWAASKHTPEPIQVTDMIKNEQPHQRPAPPGQIGHDIDQQHFNQAWQREIEKHRPDPFDQVDQTKQQRLSQSFGEQSQGQSKGNDRGRE